MSLPDEHQQAWPAAATGHRAALLTGRERTVLRLVVERYDNQAIAAALNISKRTVETHVAALLRKLAMPDRRTLISVSGPDAFRTRLTAALRMQAAASDVETLAAELIGRHLGADRAHFQQIDLATGQLTISRGYTDGQPSVAGTYRLVDFCDDAVRRALARGHTLVVRDTHRDLDPAVAAVWARLSVRAALTAFSTVDGVSVAALSVTSAGPRDWSSEDAALLEETAERTWAYGERARLRAELRLERHRFEALADSLTALVWRTDHRGRLTYANPAFRAVTGRGRGDSAPGVLLDAAAPVRDGWSGRARILSARGRPPRSRST